MNNDLFDNNINLVNKIVNKMNYGYVDKDDLTQAGLIGLYKATLKYKKEINNNFISFWRYFFIRVAEILLINYFFCASCRNGNSNLILF